MNKITYLIKVFAETLTVIVFVFSTTSSALAITAKDISFDKAPTPQQIKELDALSPEERDKLMKEVMKKMPAKTMPVPVLPEGTVNCSDYYRPESVQVNLRPDHDRYAPTETITFSGEITNQNDYTVVDGYVFARISKKNTQDPYDVGDIIDEFTPLEKIALDAKEIKKTLFTLVIPEEVEAGDYRIDYFYTVGKKFNLGGLPFSDGVRAGSANFRVDSSTKGSIVFDRTKTVSKSMFIIQDIKNTSPQHRSVIVTYDLFFWDSLNEKDKIITKTETVVIPAKSHKMLVYMLPQTKDTIEYLRITAVSGTQKSILNIRQINDGTHPHFGYTGITAFPIIQGSEATLFGCFNNTSFSDTKGSVTVTLTDRGGNKIKEAFYSGVITAQSLAVAQKIIPLKDHDFLVLSAEVKDAKGNTIDSYETTYDCKTINTEACKKLSTLGVSSGKTLGVSVVVLALLLSVAIFVIRKRKDTHTFSQNE